MIRGSTSTVLLSSPPRIGEGPGEGFADALPDVIALQLVSAPPAATGANGEVALLTGRTLYTSLEGAAIHSPEADKLHREEGVFVNQYDAAELGIAMHDDVVLKNGASQLSLKATLTTAVPRGAVFVPRLYDGGAVGALLPAENGSLAVPRVTLSKANGATPAPGADPKPSPRRTGRKRK
jgi:predicted molibdopterin-dependent oxidoreductase YjgC